MKFFTIKSLPLGDAITLLSLYPILTVFLVCIGSKGCPRGAYPRVAGTVLPLAIRISFPHNTVAVFPFGMHVRIVYRVSSTMTDSCPSPTSLCRLPCYLYESIVVLVSLGV
jgi:hypothetical protein